MRGKALSLALLLFASALAGCIREDTEDTQDDCEARGGTWIEDRRMCQEE